MGEVAETGTAASEAEAPARAVPVPGPMADETLRDRTVSTLAREAYRVDASARK